MSFTSEIALDMDIGNAHESRSGACPMFIPHKGMFDQAAPCTQLSLHLSFVPRSQRGVRLRPGHVTLISSCDQINRCRKTRSRRFARFIHDKQLGTDPYRQVSRSPHCHAACSSHKQPISIHQQISVEYQRTSDRSSLQHRSNCHSFMFVPATLTVDKSEFTVSTWRVMKIHNTFGPFCCTLLVSQNISVAGLLFAE